MKILFLMYSNTDTCSLYRAGGIATDLQRQAKVEIDIFQWDKTLLNWQVLMKYNVVMMQRAFDQQALTMTRYLKLLHIPVWIDWDDLMTDCPPENKMYPTISANKENIIELAKLADVISVPTEALRTAFSEYNKNIKLIPNAFNDTFFKREERPRSKTVLWRGSPEHVRDVLSFRDALNRLIEVYPHWKFRFHGLNPWMLTERPNIEFAPVCDPFLFYRDNVKEAPLLLHVPLADTPFNRCKSNIAWIEATYFGAVCIGPKWDGWDIPGIIPYENENWYLTYIDEVLRGEVDTEYHVKKSWEYITDNLLLSKVNKLRVELIQELVG
jgi:hypothetical protein